MTPRWMIPLLLLSALLCGIDGPREQLPTVDEAQIRRAVIAEVSGVGGNDASITVTTMHQAEAQVLATKGISFVPGDWQRFTAQKNPDDIVVAFRTAPDTWARNKGVEGYALLRKLPHVKFGIALDFQVIAVFMTSLPPPIVD